MNTTIKKVVLTIVAAGSLTFAQSQKIAHLSFDSLVNMMPETKIATEAAQTFLKGLEQESIAMQTELENKYKDYMEKQATMSDLLKKNREEELQQLQKRIEDFRNQADQEYRRKTADLTGPIMDKAKKGIDAVAKEGGYKYVLDTSSDRTSVLYHEASDDILLAVKKKLDSMPMATIPGVAPAGSGGIKAPQQNAPKQAPQKK
ncbi:OmpH family outer membrane protein [Aurantibacillus circumpalustris]|uniref:OmpH family outer membrane protein n=1 Tax=Aurantibacillus circumpalustris TaxID=3036359 RepID=UPI00295B3DA8|nr:OmpH family outer membrane protein [Aurantibacillus circumpalustris]